MKIISKIPDYYDHLVGYYGFDETRVYDRRNKQQDIPRTLPGKYDGTHKFLIAICGTLYPVVEHNKKLYHDAKDLPDDCPRDYNNYREFLKHYGLRKNHIFPSGYRPSTEINVETRQPVVLVDTNTYYQKKPTTFIPNLSQFGIPSVLDANTCYEQIYNFLGWLKDNPVPPDNQTDKEKVVAHGFDAKTSFRPKMK